MKTNIKPLLLLSALTAGFSLTQAGRVTAQTFTLLHSFAGAPSEGYLPYGGLTLSSNALYGTTSSGGGSGRGTVFKVNPDGSGFTTLYSYTGGNDGYQPYAGLIASGDTLYGTAETGGSSGEGTVFRLKTDGTGFTTLHSFSSPVPNASGRYTNSDGYFPYAGLILSGGTLYGTATYGGSAANGTVFKVNTDGTGFTTLHSFSGGSDGGNPYGGLILSDNTLYGTANYGGGPQRGGTVFKVNTDGTGFATLYDFAGGSDGSAPEAGLILSGNTLYGTATYGGLSANGTVFKVNTDGTGFTSLYSFTGGNDGYQPYAGLLASGNILYGTTSGGGGSGGGTVFKVNTDGTGFAILHGFTGVNDGYQPYAGLILSGNKLYGTAIHGGNGGSNNGTVFSLSLGPASAPTLTITPSNADVILTWPVNATGFTLESTTNVSTAVWTTVSPGPVIVNGQNTVTNPISGTRQFYRLSQ